MQFVHLYGIFYILLSLGAVDHHETAAVDQRRLLSQVHQNADEREVHIGPFPECTKSIRRGKTCDNHCFIWTWTKKGVAVDSQNWLQYQTIQMGWGWGFWSDPVLLLSVMEQQETRLHVQLHQSGNEHGWGRSCRNLTQGKNDGEMTLHMGNKANS